MFLNLKSFMYFKIDPDIPPDFLMKTCPRKDNCFVLGYK